MNNMEKPAYPSGQKKGFVNDFQIPATKVKENRKTGVQSQGTSAIRASLMGKPSGVGMD